MMKSYEIDFKEIFKRNYEFKFFAPGRINLMGEHIDYNYGHVMPIAIDLGIYALVSRRQDKKFAFFSDNYYEDGLIEVSFDELGYNKSHSFANYPKAVIKSMIDNGIVFEKGLNIYFYSSLPEQGGVSSSACIEVLTATVLNEIYNLSLTPLELAIRCHKGATEYLQLNSGIMDQAAISLARDKHALFLDTFMLNYEYVPYNIGDYSIIVCQTNKPSIKINAKYKQRVRECERALDIIKNNFNVLTLPKIPHEYLSMIENILPDRKLYRRVYHVVTEEERVLKSYEALKKGDIEVIAECMNESHESLRDNYEVSCKELDTIVSLARNEQGCIASRMTGAGFGGCALALVHNDFLVEFKEHMAKNYFEATGIHGAFFEVDACGGPRRLPKETDSLADAIASLVQYAVDSHLIDDEDSIYCKNQVLALLHLDEIEDGVSHPEPLYMIIDTILNYATTAGLIDNSSVSKQNFDTKLMNIFVPRPSCVIQEFQKKCKKSIDAGLAYFYNLSLKSNYIRENLFSKNVFFEADSEFGKIQISINQARVEHDTVTKEKLLEIESINYPKCPLCKESVGYQGRLDYPSRENHRVIPITLDGDPFYFQYTPYPYFKEHSIVLNAYHTPAKMGKKTFKYMFDFEETFGSYFIGTNADLKIVGGGILNHEHFHSGRYHFPIEDAEALFEKEINGVSLKVLKWPVSVIRLVSSESRPMIDLATNILNLWRKYDDLECSIIANDGELHNAITPILRKKGELFELDLVLRNNRQSEKYPLGIFHPHAEYLHIKKENMGLFEMMGFAVLPKRLKEEISLLKEGILKNDFNYTASLEKHRSWVTMLVNKYTFTKDNINEIFEYEIGDVFLRMLKDCAVFKSDEEGFTHFMKFVNLIK